MSDELRRLDSIDNLRPGAWVRHRTTGQFGTVTAIDNPSYYEEIEVSWDDGLTCGMRPEYLEPVAGESDPGMCLL